MPIFNDLGLCTFFQPLQFLFAHWGRASHMVEGGRFTGSSLVMDSISKEIIAAFLQLVSGAGVNAAVCGSATAYLLPDFGPNGCSVGNARKLTGHMMPIQRFHVLTREMLSFYPHVADFASSLTTYSARRLLPTIADAVQMAGEKRKDLGHWQGSKELAANSQNVQMADRYSEARSFSQALTRRQLIEHVRAACKSAGKKEAFAAGDWPSILIKSASLQKCEELAKEHFRQCQDFPSASAEELAKVTAKLKISKLADSSSSDSSGSDISSSVQSGAAESSNDENEEAASSSTARKPLPVQFLASRHAELVEMAKKALARAEFAWCTADDGCLHIHSHDRLACGAVCAFGKPTNGLATTASALEPWCKSCLIKFPPFVQRAYEVLTSVTI